MQGDATKRLRSIAIRLQNISTKSIPFYENISEEKSPKLSKYLRRDIP